MTDARPPRRPKQFIVVREWLTRHKKRTLRIAAGPYSTRAKAQAAIERSKRMRRFDDDVSVYHIVRFHSVAS